MRYLLVALFLLSGTIATAKIGLREQSHLQTVENTPGDVRALAKTMPKIQDLHFGWPGMDDRAMEAAGTLKTLETIHIGNPSIYYSDGRVLNVQVSSKGWKELQGLPKLRELIVNDVKISTDSMKEIGQLKTLQTLYLAHNDITDDGVKHLGALTQLTKLALLQAKITDDIVPILAKLTNLVTLDVDQTQLTDKAVPMFLKLEHLRDLDIRFTKISPAGVKELAASKSLRSLSVLQAQVPSDILGTLREANRKLSVNITDKGRYLHPLGVKP